MKIIYKTDEAIPIGLRRKLKEKLILTTVEIKIEKFEIEIEKVENQHRPNPKSMVIRITDLNFRKTGGIVQGRLAAPSFKWQAYRCSNPRFHQRSTKGYGLFIEWMLEEDNKI